MYPLSIELIEIDILFFPFLYVLIYICKEGNFMKKLKIRVPNFIIKIVNWMWVMWSNLRWCKAKKIYPLLSIDLISKKDIHCSYDVIKFCKEAATRIYSNFTWTDDGIDQLKDAIRPPA